MHTTLVLAVAFSLLAIASSHAQSLDVQCKDRGYFLKKTAEVETTARDLDKSVETVPPADSEYIRKESRIAIEQNNSRRFSNVASSRYYAALQFHEDMAVAINNIVAAKSAPMLNNAAVYLSVVVSRMGDAAGTMSSYIESDGRRTPSMLGENERKNLYFQMPMLRDAVLRLLQCAVGSL